MAGVRFKNEVGDCQWGGETSSADVVGMHHGNPNSKWVD